MGSTYPPSYAPRLSLEVGSETLPEYDYVSDVVVDTTVDGADHFSAILTHPFDHEQVDFEELPWGEIDPTEAKPVTVELGYGESLTTVFQGAVESMAVEFEPGDPPRGVVTGYGPLRDMMRGTNADSWEEPTIEDLVGAVAGDYLGSLEIQKADMQLERRFQRDHQSDYDFVRELADDYGFEFFADLGTGYFRPQPAGNPSEAPCATLYYGESLEYFRAERRAPDHGTLEVRYYDEAEEQEVVGSASNGDGSGTDVVRTQVDSEAEANAVAASLLQGTQTEGVAETFGVPSIRAGKVVEVEGVGEIFSGEHYVTEATHRFGDDGYTMSMELTNI